MSSRRARIELGPGGAVYLAVTLLLLAATLYTQANLLFWALGLMFGGLLVSFAYAAQVLRGLEIRRLTPGRAVVGDALVLRYRLVNHNWLPALSVMVIETWGHRRRGWRRYGPVAQKPPRLRQRPIGWLLHAGPRQPMQAQARCYPIRRGPLELDRILVQCAFPFGIVRKTVMVRQPATTLVYPAIHRLRQPLAGALVARFDAASQRQRERGGGDGEFFGLRGYRLGDPPKLIDFKRSARLGELVTRELTRPAPPRVMILLDLTRPRRDDAGSALEQAISLAASVICEAHLRQRRVGLAVCGPRCPSFAPHHGLMHRARMLEALARLPIDDGSALGESAALAVEPTVIICRCPEQAAGYRRGRGRATVIAAEQIARHADTRQTLELRSLARPDRPAPVRGPAGRVQEAVT